MVLTGPEPLSGITLFQKVHAEEFDFGTRFFVFLCSAAAPQPVLLEVEMRHESIIAAVTRSVAIATVREIEAVVSFVGAACLHLWLQRMPLGMPAYSGSLSVSSSLGGDAGRIDTPQPGCKRGRLLCQKILALASCPAGTVKA